MVIALLEHVGIPLPSLLECVHALFDCGIVFLLLSSVNYNGQLLLSDLLTFDAAWLNRSFSTVIAHSNASRSDVSGFARRKEADLEELWLSVFKGKVQNKLKFSVAKVPQ
jgi:hypothetical protein